MSARLLSGALWTPRDFFLAIYTAVASCSIDASLSGFEMIQPSL